MVWTTFHRFVIALTGAGWEASDVQRLCDLAFLWKLADLHGAKGIELCHLLDERMNEKVQLQLSLIVHCSQRLRYNLELQWET